MGDRDSEVNVVIEDVATLPFAALGGHFGRAGRFARSLRIRLMATHTGCTLAEAERKYGDLCDPAKFRNLQQLGASAPRAGPCLVFAQVILQSLPTQRRPMQTHSPPYSSVSPPMRSTACTRCVQPAKTCSL